MGQLPSPSQDGWQQLCDEAEQRLDREPEQFEREWLPRALAHCAAWPAALRRCPPEWITTPRLGAERLLSLCRVPAEQLAVWDPVRDDDGRWTLLTNGDPEFLLLGDEQPQLEALVVVSHVLASWHELEAEAVAKLVTLEAAGTIVDDPYVDLSRRPPKGRWASSGLVEIRTPPHFGVHVDDLCFAVNGWPYGHWVVNFMWGKLASIEMGFEFEYRATVWTA